MTPLTTNQRLKRLYDAAGGKTEYHRFVLAHMGYFARTIQIVSYPPREANDDGTLKPWPKVPTIGSGVPPAEVVTNQEARVHPDMNCGGWSYHGEAFYQAYQNHEFQFYTYELMEGFDGFNYTFVKDILDPCRWCVTESAELDKFKLAGESTLFRKRMYDFEIFYHMSEEQVKEKVQAWREAQPPFNPDKLTSPGASVRVTVIPRCQHPGCNKPAYSLSDLNCVADHGGGPRCQHPGCNKPAYSPLI